MHELRFFPSQVLRRRIEDQLSRFERASSGGEDAPALLEDLRGLALVFDLNPRDLEFRDLWRLVRPRLMESLV